MLFRIILEKPILFGNDDYILALLFFGLLFQFLPLHLWKPQKKSSSLNGRAIKRRTFLRLPLHTFVETWVILNIQYENEELKRVNYSGPKRSNTKLSTTK